MAKKKKVKTKAKRIVTFGTLSIFLITLIVATLLGVVVETLDKYKEKNNLKNQLIMLQEKEKELENNVNKLEDPKYLARYAREKYFYSKNGELIIRIPENEE